jgi:hypothetical protein
MMVAMCWQEFLVRNYVLLTAKGFLDAFLSMVMDPLSSPLIVKTFTASVSLWERAGEST